MSYAKLTTELTTDQDGAATTISKVVVYPENLSARLADHNNNSYEALLSVGYEQTGPMVLDETGRLVYPVDLVDRPSSTDGAS